jgi:hypothetical protein
VAAPASANTRPRKTFEPPDSPLLQFFAFFEATQVGFDLAQFLENLSQQIRFPPP